MIVQKNDTRCKEVFNILKNGSKKEKENVSKNYKIMENRLYRIINGNFRWVVPEAAKAQITRMFHDEMGHQGINKTIAKMETRIWFPRMRKYVKDYIYHCLECAYSKRYRTQPGKFYIPSKPTKPMDTLHLDHLGPLLTTKRKNTHILVVVDSFTKYTWTYPTRFTGSNAVIKYLKLIIDTYGVPRRIIADRGPAFNSKAFKIFCKNNGIQLMLTAVATPRGNGQVERVNAVIIDRLVSTIENEEDWDRTLSRVQMYINNSVNEATKNSPNELFFGYKPALPEHAFLTNAIDLQMEPPVEPIKNFEDLLVQLRAKAIERNQLQQIKTAARHEHREPAKEFKIGDFVLLPNTGPGSKLKDRKKGPFVITNVYPRDRYRVQNIDGSHRKYNSVHSAEHLHKITLIEE